MIPGRRSDRTRLACSIGLPAGFRANDVLNFHRRDALAFAERVDGACLQKGLTWKGDPACLEVRFGTRRAQVALAVDGSVSGDAQTLRATARRMLGLTQDIEAFEKTHRTHPDLAPLISRQSGLRVPLSPTPFEALSWAITGQQISLAAALSLRRNLIRLAGARHSSGIACYPDSERVADLGEAKLRRVGFSRAKARTLAHVAREITHGQLRLDVRTCALPIAKMREQLLNVPGIGPWTVNYVLLRGFGWLDGSLHGDAAVRRKLQQLLDTKPKMSAKFVECWLAQFSPWRALVAAHLWAMP